MKSLPLALLVIAELGSFAVVSAQSVLFDFGPTAITTGSSKINSPGHATGDVPAIQVTWNQIGTTDVSSGLKFGDNTAATGVAIDLGVETNSTSNIIGFSTQPNSSLQGNNGSYSAGIYTSDAPARDFIFNSANNEPWAIGARVIGLSQGVYNVYISGANTNSSAAGTMNFFAASVATGATTFDFNSAPTTSATNDPSGAASWTQGVNYAVFSVSVTSLQDLAIAVSGTGTGSGGRGFLNSLEVVRVGDISSVPEPASFAAIVGLAATGIIWRRRRRNA
jgi:hypothetical protein